MSWFPSGTGVIAEIKGFLGKICDPYLNIFRKFIPPIGGMIDISPIIALFVLQLIVRLIVGIL
ncbi:MAG: YggT family protein [Eggerthellaceae bacterium]|nr:YggT family protein [Eggerthellaceae bacterium]